jgi:hypothetical protein
MIAGNAEMPSTSGTGTMTGNKDNGYAKISLIVITPIEGEVSYATTTLTNQDVLVTLTLNQTGHIVEAGRTATGENDSVFASEIP